FLRAYHVAEGHWRPDVVAGWGGGTLPTTAIAFAEGLVRLQHNAAQKYDATDRYNLRCLRDQGERRPVAYSPAATYTSVPYLPQALGLRVGMRLGLTPFGL